MAEILKTTKRNNVDSFEEFLRKKKEEEESNKVDWNERRLMWYKSIEKLYNSIKEWLLPFEKKSLLKLEEKEIDLSEDYIGFYKVKKLDIYLGNDKISLIPRGTLIVGSYGRIDMRGPKGEIMIIEPEWNKWKFAKRTPSLITWDINKESFESVIQELING